MYLFGDLFRSFFNFRLLSFFMVFPFFIFRFFGGERTIGGF